MLSRNTALLSRMRAHFAFLALAAVALGLLLTGLGSDYLWADEGDTAVLASNVLNFGVPKAWDGVTFTDSDRGARVNDSLVMVSHPWLQYYVAAASLAVCGENAFAARLPFALCGWLTLIAVYLLVVKVSGSRSAGFIAAALLVTSVQFLLYARQCRYYALTMLLTCALVAVFLRMRSPRAWALFVAIATLLFHTHPLGFAIIGGLGLATLLRPFAPQRKWFWLALPVIIVLTLPWLLLAPHGHSETGAPLRSATQFVTRLAQFAIESTSVTPLIGCAVLVTIAATLRRLRRRDGDFFLLCAATLAAYAAAMVLTQSAQTQWYVGVRYTPALLPLISAAAGILIIRVAGGRAAIWLPLLMLVAFTKVALLTPWICWSRDIDPPRASKPIGVHVPPKLIDCFVGGGQLAFMRSLGRPNPGTVGAACEFLRRNAAPKDVFLTNYEWDPLYFHSRLPQALKILPNYPIEPAARRANLPAYVFGVKGVRWVLWRPAWDGYLDYRGEQIERAIIEEGGRVEQAAQFSESVWENRENIHFHRFADGEHLFPWPTDSPPAQMLRVSWP